MTFDDILGQVITLLQRQGRVSYRALKMRFNLDDEYLDVLKEELIDAQRIAMDEDGRILVWTGETGGAPVSSSLSMQAEPQAPTQHDQPTPHTPEAERRQLTVMFCDLVDSTKLSSQLDPEDLREVIRGYQQVCSVVITRFDGYIAQYLGDGLLVYFGYPVAHEDDAQRAVRAGLGILAALEDLNISLKRDKGIQLAIRLGIHTGLVVVGAMGGGGRHEQLALGETPNIAARLQGLAEPNTIAVSEATLRLVQGYFDCQDLGAQTLRGVAEPLHVYRVLQESGVRGRLDVAQMRGLTPLVGRESEVTLLLERWEQVKARHGHVVLLSGEGGIGKSRLVQVLKDQSANEPHIRWECRSFPYYQNTALYPIIDLLQRLLPWQPNDAPEEKLATLAQELRQYRLPVEESVQLFAPLLSLPVPEHHYPPLNLSPQRQRQRTLEALVTILVEQAERHPVLLIIEDLHWTDPTTLEFLNLVIDQTPTAALFVLLTCRPYFQPSWHHRSYLTEMTLNHLSHAQVAQIVHGMTDGKTFPSEVLQQIIAKTDGVPLFAEEMTKVILESGQLKAVDGHYELTGSFSTLAIPATLQDSLMARLDRLVTAKAVAQYAAVIGRQFSYELLQAVSQVDEVILQHELGRLVEAEIVYHKGVPPQATYTFKHALIQDAAYQSLLRSTRQQYHQRIAQIVEAQFPETAEAEPELLAHHYTAAGLTAQAVHYWHHAGQHALQRSANQEAVQHLTTGLALLATLPETPARAQQELDLQLVLGAALLATKGGAAPEVGQAYDRARVLCAHVGETPQFVLALRGLCGLYRNQGALRTAQELGDQLVHVVEDAPDPMPRLEAHEVLGSTLFLLGDYAAAWTHLEQGIALIDPSMQRAEALRQGESSGVRCLAYAANTLWCLGYPAQAVQRSQEALALAQHLAHPRSLAQAQHFASFLHYRRREAQMAQVQAEALLALATAQGFPVLVGFGTFWHGWALVMQGQTEAGMAQIRQGMAVVVTLGQMNWRMLCLLLLAEANASGGPVEQGLSLLAEARTVVEANGQGDLLVEVYRLQGELLQRQDVPDAAQAEACFQQALAIARRQQAKSWELRTAMSLARLWQQQGKRGEAYELLAPIYGWFTEGFATADLQEAKALLEALA